MSTMPPQEGSAADRPIDGRFVPGVAGIDLEQALNYIELDAVGETFAYDHYTSRRLFYVAGSRPRLEWVAQSAAGEADTDLDRVRLLARWVAEEVRWAGYYAGQTGTRLPSDRCPSEEELIDSGYGWCNEQARLFCVLTQVQGITSRLVFACNKERGYGHCIAEVLLDTGWMAVDQSFGFCFIMDETPVRAAHIFHDPRARAWFMPAYKKVCRRLIAELGPAAESDFAMAAAENPLDGFTDIGFHNYFVH